MENKKIILLCHGTWAKALLKDAQSHFKLNGNYEVLPLLDDMSTDDYLRQIQKSIDGHEVILVSDLFPGSTSTIATKIALTRNVQAISGLSLQLLLCLDDLWGEKSFEQLAQECIREVSGGCKDLVLFFKECQREENI